MTVRSRTATLACGLILSISGTAVTAADATRPSDPSIAALQRQVEALRARVEALEARLDAGVPVNMAAQIQPVDGGWREPHNWKLLKKGMSYHQLKDILGEPDTSRNIGKYQVWEYPNGQVKLYLRRVTSWSQ